MTLTWWDLFISRKLSNVALCGTCGSHMIPDVKLLEMYHLWLISEDQILTPERKHAVKLNEDLVSSLTRKLEIAQKQLLEARITFEQEYLNPPVEEPDAEQPEHADPR